jgi:hypothetical protein
MPAVGVRTMGVGEGMVGTGVAAGVGERSRLSVQALRDRIESVTSRTDRTFFMGNLSIEQILSPPRVLKKSAAPGFGMKT